MQRASRIRRLCSMVCSGRGVQGRSLAYIMRAGVSTPPQPEPAMIPLPWSLACAALLGLPADEPARPNRPNVVLIITDDQGHGDLGCHGNPKIRTPHLDRFAGQAVHLQQFHVMPVCSPTRACLLTGRYNYRTGVVDT